MEINKEWYMYIEIQYQKNKGFSFSRIARDLNVSRPTVTKFAKMTSEQYQQFLESKARKNKKPGAYITIKSLTG